MTRSYYILLIVLFNVCFGLTLISQNFDRINIPYTQNGKLLKLPYTGGLRGGQFSNIDFNNDGLMDLFVFDRNGDQIIPLVKTGQPGDYEFTYAPEYISIFPLLRNWALLVDFNNDGVKDIFTSSNLYPGSIEVWKGKMDGIRITFNRLNFNYGIPEILMFPISNGFTQIYVSAVDLPSIVDVDDDGDYDIVSFEPDGSYASYYQNVSKEQNLGVDSIKYIRKDICWGKFAENSQSDYITLSNSSFGCASGFTDGGSTGTRHSGSTICIFDADGDKDMDALIGDIASSKIKLLINNGTLENAFITEIDNDFPRNDVPVNIDVFLSAFYVDCDADGDRDLIVTPNQAFSSESENHVWLYQNIGTDSKPIFKFLKDDFLIDEMAFFNSSSHPVFVDVTGDGLEDIIMGSNGLQLKNGIKKNRMFLITNIGSKSIPSYELTDDDFLNFSQYNEFTGRFAPAVGDLDNDKDLDLIIGDLRGLLYYVENTAGPGKPMVFKAPIYNYFNLFVGQNANPQIIDLDNDGIKDLVVGEKNNELNFFKNVGTKEAAAFIPLPETGLANFPNSTTLGNVYSNGNDPNTQSGSPFFIKQNEKWLMLLGIEIGNIMTYDNLEGNLYGNFTLNNSKLGNISLGRKLNLGLADIDNDGFYEMAAGNERGGLTFFNTIFKSADVSNVPEVPTDDLSSFDVFPNPASNYLFLNSKSPNTNFNLMDNFGRFIRKLNVGYGNDLSGINNGLYLVEINVSGKYYYRKLIICN